MSDDGNAGGSWADARCTPSRKGTPLLDADARARLGRELPEWRVGASTTGSTPDEVLARTYRFERYADAAAFVAEVAALAESEDHHPATLLTYDAVVVELRTHAAGGLTRNDAVLAAKIERTAARARGLRRGR
ncbi:MAG TPA: 4a-hydroxytetrahydrobiopterin dehydratase [Planctomycetota bacterium]|nr:4a-hydroxytetrahydrobiopterin dehydratase [Planctomycetota bacterium]